MKNLKTKLLNFSFRFWPLVIIIIAVLIFFYPVWFKNMIPIPGDFVVGSYFPWLDYKWGTVTGVPVKNPITSDVVSINYPLKSLAVDLLKSGKIPLWNTEMFAGFPLLANMQLGIFAPTSLVYLFLPMIWAWTAQIMLQPFLAAIFTYLLLRHLKLSKLSSVLGGLTYAFAGFNLIWMEWNERTLVAAFIPLILLIVDKIIIEEKLFWALALSVFIAFQFFSGYPQLLIYTGLLCLVWVFFMRKKITRNVLGLLLLAVLLGLLVVSIQFLPGFELLLNSQRGTEILAKDLIYLPWQNLITFIAPDFFGNHTTANFWGAGNYTINVGYAGVITLILSFIAAISLFKKKEIKFFLCILFISLGFALQNPVSTFVWKFGYPGSTASSTTRALVLANLSLSCMAAYTIDLILKWKNKINLLPALFIIITILAIAGFVFKAESDTVSLALRENYTVGLRNLIQPGIFVALTTLILLLGNIYLKNKHGRTIIVILITTLSIFELFRFGWKYTPFSNIEYVFPDTPVTKYLKELEKPNRILPGDVIPMNMWVPYGLESLTGYNAAYPAWIAKYIGVSNSGDENATAQGTFGTLELFTSRFTDIANGEYLLLNNKNINDLYKKQIISDDLEKVFSDKSVSVYKKTKALPRAIFVTQWSVLPEDEILGKLLDPSFNSAKEVLLDKTPSIHSSTGPNIDSIEYLSYTADSIIINVSTQQQGLLFVSDTWYPGWKAYVDEKEVEIMRADYAFRAIAIPQGNHKIRFIYDPESFRIGEWLSLAGLGILLILCIYESKTKRGRRITQGSS